MHAGTLWMIFYFAIQFHTLNYFSIEKSNTMHERGHWAAVDGTISASIFLLILCKQERINWHTHTKKYRVYLIIPPMVEWILIGFSSVCIRTGQTCSVYAMHSMFGTHFIQCTVLVLFFYFSIKFRHCFWAHIWMHFYLFARSSFWCVVYNGN